MSVLTTILWGIPAAASFALLILLIKSQDRFARVAKSGWARILTGAVFFIIFCLTLFLLHLPVVEVLLGASSDWIAMAAFLLFAVGLFLVIPAAVGWLSDLAQLRNETDRRISAVSLTEDLISLAEQRYVLTELLTAGLRLVMTHAAVEGGMVWLLARNGVTLILAGAHGFGKPAEKAAESVVSSGQELFDRVLRGNQVVTAGDLGTRTRFVQSFPGMEAFGSIALVPLSGGGELIGMMLLASETSYYFGPEMVRTLSGAGRVLGGAVSGQRLARDIQKLEKDLAEKQSALGHWETVMGGGVPATAQTVLHGLMDAAQAKAAFLVPSGARFIAAATEPSLHGLPMDGVWSEAMSASEQNRRALWVNPGKAPTDPRAGFGRWILTPSPAGALFFAPAEGRTTYNALELGRFARMGELALLLIPAEEQAEPDRLLELAGRLGSEAGAPEVLAEVAAELVPGADAVIVWRRSEGRLSVAAVQGCAAEPLEKLHLPVGQGTIGKAALAVQPLVIESGAEMGRSWAEYSARERGAFAEAFGGFERPAAEFAAPIPHADLVLQFVRFTRGGWPEGTRRLVDALVHIYSAGEKQTPSERPRVDVPAGWNEAANDLNNIFTGILGQAELLNRRLAEGGLPEAERRGLEQIIEAAQQGGDLISELAPTEGEDEAGGLDGLAAEVLSGRHITDDLYLLPDNRAVQIRTEFEKTPKLSADRQKLQTVLWTALTTVAKDQTTVSLGTAADERYLYLAVGGPNTREPLSGPFGDFFRAPDLGWRHLLPPAELDFLRSVGAQIAADDERVPQRMVVRFPYGPAAASAKPMHPGLNVLAIDDQEIIRDLLLNMFMGMGHRITVCKSGEDGLAALDQAKFDLVLTDLGMPGMSGWEVAHAVKEKSPDTPVVLITGWGFNFAEEQVRKAGVDYVLTKPFRLEHLTEVVETAVRRSPQVH